MCSNVALPKTQQHSFVSNALSSIRRCQLIPVAQIDPTNTPECDYLAQALHAPPSTSDRKPHSSNYETIELHRRNGVGGIVICSASAPIGHILYQSNDADVHVRSIESASVPNDPTLNTALAVLTTLALARSRIGSSLVFDTEANEDVDNICYQVGLCSSELGIQALPGAPRTFNLLLRPPR